MYTYIKSLNKTSRTEVGAVGGKGGFLGELHKLGFSVPEGFVIKTDMYKDFLVQNDLLQKIEALLLSLKNSNTQNVFEISETIQQMILGASLSKKMENEIIEAYKNLGTKSVAVRSSANAEDGATSAWAGQFDSYLNVTQTNLLESVKKCWSSLFNARALLYQSRKEILRHLEMAVVIQTMIEGDVSGVTFSVHPVTNNKKHILIEAALGLGEKVVSGSVSPSRYLIEKQYLQILDQPLTQQVLAENQVKELAQTTTQIERLIGLACDIEWTISKNKIWILQTRPITTEQACVEQQINAWQELEDADLLFTVTEDYWLPFYLESSAVIGKYGEAHLIFLYRNPRMEVYMPRKYSDIPAEIGFKIFSDMKQRNEYLNLSSCAMTDVEKLLFEKVEGFSHLPDQQLMHLFKKGYVLFSKLFSLFRYTELHYFAKLERIINNIVQEQVADVQLRQKVLTDLLDAEKNFHHFDLSEEMKIIRDSVDHIGKIKLVMRTALSRLGSEFVFGIIEEFAKRLEVDSRVLECCVYDEIINAIRDADKRSEVLESARKRGEKFVAITTEDSCKFLSDEEADKILERFHNTSFGNEQISGVVASYGVHTGEAVLLNVGIGKENMARLNKKISLMKKGQVVVAPTTGPEMMAALSKAGAIVANEGGIISHAAVISRELKIPCIVNTKRATDVIKDGDLIKVDAECGVVTILR